MLQLLLLVFKPESFDHEFRHSTTELSLLPFGSHTFSSIVASKTQQKTKQQNWKVTHLLLLEIGFTLLTN